jgi:hypothetical protein
VWQRLDRAVLSPPEQEELELGAGVHDEAELLGPLDLAAQDAARIADERLPVRREHVADDARRAARPRPRLPRDLGERIHVWHQVLIGLRDPREALDRGAVEPGPVLDRALELVDRDRHRFDVADDVGELELDEADAARLRGFDLGGGVGAGFGSGCNGQRGAPPAVGQGYARPLWRPGADGSASENYISL